MSAPHTPLAAAAPRRFVRSAGFGLAAGCFLGGLGLLALAARAIFLGPDCTGLPFQECALLGEVASHLALRQVIVGGALALLGVAVFSLVRDGTRAGQATAGRDSP